MSEFPRYRPIQQYVIDNLNLKKNQIYTSRLNSWIRVTANAGAGLVLQSNPNVPIVPDTSANSFSTGIFGFIILIIISVFFEGNVQENIKQINFESWMNYVEKGDIFFDSGMYQGNNRNYSQWRSVNSFWEELVQERYTKAT